MKIYPATLPTSDQQPALTKFNKNERLISYHFLKDKRPDLIKDIADTGMTDYIDRPDDPPGEIPADVKIICGGWWNGEEEKTKAKDKNNRTR